MNALAELMGLHASLGSFIRWAAESMTALLCAMASRSAAYPDGNLNASALFWRSLAVILLLVGISSLVNGEALWLDSAREIFKDQGVYELRRIVQFLTLLVAGAGFLYLQRGLQRMVRKLQDADLCGLALRGVSLVLLVLVLDLISLHYIDSLMYLRLAGLSMARWLQGLGLGMVGLSALRFMHRRAQSGRHHV